MPADPLADVVAAAADLTRAREELERAQNVHEEAIRAALAAGASGIAVARAAGLSSQRVYQIKAGHRGRP